MSCNLYKIKSYVYKMLQFKRMLPINIIMTITSHLLCNLRTLQVVYILYFFF